MSESFTESTLLDLVTEDGRSGFMVRLARHVDEGRAWAWLVTFGPEGVHGFVDDGLHCPAVRTADDGSIAEYAVTLPATHGASAWLRRNGSADAVTGGSCEIDVLGHATHDVPRGPGRVRMVVRAQFRARAHRSGSNLPGRTESVVDVDAAVSIAGTTHTVRGLGQFHEQLQDAPRFDTPFTYVSLRGQHNSLVALRGPKAGRAVVQRADGPRSHPGFTIESLDADAPMTPRRLRIDAPDGSDGSGPLLTGQVVATVRYTLPINGRPRPSAIVRGDLDGEPVTGFVNDWTP